MSAASRWWAIAGLALAGVVWLPTLGQPLLIWDDLCYLLGAVERVGQGELLEPRPYFRPVAEAAFAAIWALFGAQAPAYRAAVVGAHFVNGGLVCLIARGLGLAMPSALMASACFLLAPIHRETVLWSAGFIQVLGGTGALACAALAVRGWLWGWEAAAVILAFACGMFAYPHMILFPIAVYAAWALLFRDRRRPTRLLLAACGVALVWGAMEYVIPVIQRGGIYPYLSDAGRSPAHGLLTTARNLVLGLIYAWCPEVLVEAIPSWMGWIVKSLWAGATAAILASAARGGPAGRWLTIWTVLTTFPFILRGYVDARMLYVTAAGMSIILAMSVGRLPERWIRLGRAGLAGVVLLNALVLLRWSQSYRQAGDAASGLVASVRLAAPAHRPGGLVVLRGFTRWVGRAPWTAPFLIYPPQPVVAWVLGDPTAEILELGAGMPLPAAKGRSVVVVDR